MLNTNRFLHKHNEVNHRVRPLMRRTWRASHQSFQWKYTVFLITTIFGTTSALLGITYYRLQQNYEIFLKLAFDTNPELIQHLEREMTQFGILFTAILISVFLVCLLMGLKFTSGVIRPAVHLERHMRKVTQGDWSASDFRYKQTEDLIDLLDTYSYLYRSLRANTENDIHMLEQLVIDPNNRESISIWKTLVGQKRAQLNLPGRSEPIIAIGEETSAPPASRRAS